MDTYRRLGRRERLAHVRRHVLVVAHEDLRKKINRSHIHTPTENNTPDTDTHTTRTNTPNPQTNISHKQITTLEGGATTVLAVNRIYI